MREKLNDILGVVELIRCFLLQEGKSAMKKNDKLISGQNKTLFFSDSFNYLHVLPTDLKRFAQNGHIFKVILRFLCTDVQYFGNALELLQKLGMD